MASRAMFMMPFVLLASACASRESRNGVSIDVSGCWIGAAHQSSIDGNAAWFVDRYSDGTFEITFYPFDEDETLLPMKESGTWSLEGTTLTMATDKIYLVGLPPSEVDEAVKYKVLYSHNDVLVYSNSKSGKSFAALRVMCDR